MGALFVSEEIKSPSMSYLIMYELRLAPCPLATRRPPNSNGPGPMTPFDRVEPRIKMDFSINKPQLIARVIAFQASSVVRYLKNKEIL